MTCRWKAKGNISDSEMKKDFQFWVNSTQVSFREIEMNAIWVMMGLKVPAGQGALQYEVVQMEMKLWRDI